MGNTSEQPSSEEYSENGRRERVQIDDQCEQYQFQPEVSYGEHSDSNELEHIKEDFENEASNEDLNEPSESDHSFSDSKIEVKDYELRERTNTEISDKESEYEADQMIIEDYQIITENGVVIKEHKTSQQFTSPIKKISEFVPSTSKTKPQTSDFKTNTHLFNPQPTDDFSPSKATSGVNDYIGNDESRYTYESAEFGSAFISEMREPNVENLKNLKNIDPRSEVLEESFESFISIATNEEELAFNKH